MILAGKSRWLIPFCGVLILLAGSASSTQNLEFRMATLERRIDQLQNRVDTVEREQRMQTLSSSTRPAVTPETVQELQHAKTECRIIGSLDCFCQQFASFKLLLCCHLVIFPFRFGSTVPVIVTLQLKYSSKASTSSRVSRTSLIVIGARISKLSVGNSTFTRFLSSPFGPRLVAADAGCCRAQAYCGESIQLSRIPALTATGSRLPQAGCARSQFSRGSRR